MRRTTALPANLPPELRTRLRHLAARGWRRTITPDTSEVSMHHGLAITLSKNSWRAAAQGPGLPAVTAAVEQAEHCEQEPSQLLAERIEQWWRAEPTTF